MPSYHAYQIATKIKEIIEQLLTDLVTEFPSNPEVSRVSQKLYVNIQKGPRESEDSTMAIGEGIRIIPLKPEELPGTNEREDMGYQFLVTIAQGTFTEDLPDSWRIGIVEQNIRQRFQQKRTGVTLDSACELGCTVTAGELPRFVTFKDGVDASYLVITCFIRESRRA